MCNPFWTQIKPDSTLTITAQVDGSAHVVCEVTSSNAGGTTQENRFTIDQFPITLPLKAGALHRAQVNVTSIGKPGYVTVTATVTGAHNRGPDVCRLEVDSNHPYAFEVIIAEARHA